MVQPSSRRAAASRDVQGESDRGGDRLDALVGKRPLLRIEALRAGYGRTSIVHGLDLCVDRGQSLCLIGPNGAGKSTVLNAVFGLCTIQSGRITLDEGATRRDITRLAPQARLTEAGIAYVLQESSLFADMSVEENLLMGAFPMRSATDAARSIERIFERYTRLAARRRQRAGVLSGGERRLLEIARALIMDPRLLLLDEPSIGLEPKYIDMVFEMLHELQYRDGKTIMMVEQNTRKALALVDVACVMVSGRIALVGEGRELLDDPAVERLFLCR